MEEAQTQSKYITIIRSTITFADGTKFHASPEIIKQLNKRLEQTGKIPTPTHYPDQSMYFDIMWIEE